MTGVDSTVSSLGLLSGRSISSESLGLLALLLVVVVLVLLVGKDCVLSEKESISRMLMVSCWV